MTRIILSAISAFFMFATHTIVPFHAHSGVARIRFEYLVATLAAPILAANEVCRNVARGVA